MSGIIGIKAINGLLDLTYKYLHFKIGRISFQDNRVHIGPKIEMRVVTLGLDEAGKTSILFKLKQNEFIQTIPTIGMFLGKQLQLIPDFIDMYKIQFYLIKFISDLWLTTIFSGYSIFLHH